MKNLLALLLLVPVLAFAQKQPQGVTYDAQIVRVNDGIEECMDISRTVKVGLTNMIWLITEFWICFFKTFKDLTLNHHISCANF